MSATVRVRPARAGDLVALVALESAFPTDRLGVASFRHLLARAHADVIAAERDGALAGDAVVLYRRGSAVARLYSLVVDPRLRGQGLGGRLLAAAERAAARRGCRRLRLEVRPDNAAALGLYERAGYRCLGFIEGFYEDGTAALRLEKPLAPIASTTADTRNRLTTAAP